MSELRIGVDIGCGLRSNIHTNQGVDYAVCVDNNLETLKNNQQVRAGQTRAVCADIRALPFRGEVLSLISATHTLEHLPQDDAKTTLAQAYKALKPKGKLIAAVPTPGMNKSWVR